MAWLQGGVSILGRLLLALLIAGATIVLGILAFVVMLVVEALVWLRRCANRLWKSICLAGASAGIVYYCGILFLWAIWKDVQIRTLRVVGAKKTATRIETETDQLFWQMCGISGPDED